MANTNMHAAVKLTDGTEADVTIIMADLARYDILRARNNYPPRDESVFLFMAIAGYCAMKRTEQLPAGMKLEQFIECVESIDEIEDETAAGDDAAEGAEFRTAADD